MLAPQVELAAQLIYLLCAATSLRTVRALPAATTSAGFRDVPGDDRAAIVSCFSNLSENELSSLVEHNAASASITLCVQCAGPQLLTCLNKQREDDRNHQVIYKVALEGDSLSAKYIHPVIHTWKGSASELVLEKVPSTPAFQYVIYGGRYQLLISVCHTGQAEEEHCEEEVETGFVSIQSDMLPGCQQHLWSNQSANHSHISKDLAPVVEGSTATFQFSYQPCSQIQPYETANVSMYEVDSVDQGCEELDIMDVGDGGVVRQVAQGVVHVTGTADGNTNITYTSPRVQGDRYYCIVAELNHITCLLPSVNPPQICRLASKPVWIGSEPLLAQLLPFCRSHLSCGWVYVVICGSGILVVSLCLAVICVRCCDRKSRKKQSFIQDEVDFCGGEVINLTSSLPERRTWQEVHQEWKEEGGERSRGKILLLYSPDTKLFKELQEAMKSFLEMACHCDIYDLFDDALFDTIALDPGEWLQQFTKDSDVKIIIISSIGAYRRQMALQQRMPLNLPENSLLDGLFTSGLKFVSSHPELASSGRVATARYEMLHLTEEGHRLGPPIGGGANNEFLIPTELHELFCWVHQLQPLDLMGKPWSNYHLELQLLQDALKLVRRDRTLMSSNMNGNNGITQL